MNFRSLLIVQITLVSLFPRTAVLQEILNNSTREDTQTYQINENTQYIYQKPKPFEFIKNGLVAIGTLIKMSVKKENLRSLGVVTASTLLMIAYDQQIVDEAQRIGTRLNISSDNFLKTYVAVGDYPIFQGPTDLGSTLYFLGDGWTHSAIAFSFLGFGLLKNDYRAQQTFSQLAEGMVSTGTSSQILKHITGRESPFAATVPGGRWDFFPDQIEYHKHVSEYDAFPSGHLATAYMTYLVIKENYPEKKYIKPLGITLLSLLSYQMLNNGVHWISDYPLALIIGHAGGKIAVKRGRKVISANGETEKVNVAKKSRLHVTPMYMRQRVYGLTLQYIF